jgi:diguanylate cyclase (GGDEF)-like protein
MQNNYSIGEFSEITGISKRMLRHYDKLNLFCPIEINEGNGYRYYSENQIDDLDKVQFLRKLGFTLSAVGKILEKPIGLTDFIELLKDKEVELTKESDELKSNLVITSRMINLLEKQSPKMFPSIYKLLDWERSMTMTATIETVDLKSLMNRDMFMEKIEESINKDQGDHYFFLTFDIDNFMHVNDFDGYDVGDKVIQTVFTMIINEIKALVDESDENLVARLGGDECSVFLKNADTVHVLNGAEKVLQRVRNYDFKASGCTVKVSVSCGIASGKKPKHIAALMDTSVKALIEAKRGGRDQYVLRTY